VFASLFPGYKPNTGTYTVSLLPAQAEIDTADLNALFKVIMAFVKERLGLKDQKSNVFPEKITSTSVFVACVIFTLLVRLFNGASGPDLIAKLTAYQSFIGHMQTLLLDKYDADNKFAKSYKVRMARKYRTHRPCCARVYLVDALTRGEMRACEGGLTECTRSQQRPHRPICLRLPESVQFGC
jgi:hypothetical protein